MFTDEQIGEIGRWKKVEDILSSNIIDPIVNYRDIIQSFLLDDRLLEPFITATINNGNKRIVEENIDALDINKNWKIAELSPEFKEILLQNFDKVLACSTYIDSAILEKINYENKFLIINNWKAINKLTEKYMLDRKYLIRILNSTEEGRNIVDSELPTLFYGDYPYSAYIHELLKDKVLNEKQIASLILAEPDKIITKELETRM